MLLNEAKFLGLQFTIVRWILTVIAIVIFSWIASKIVKDTDITTEEEKSESGIVINENTCMGCTLCTKTYPSLFKMEGNKAVVIKYSDKLDSEKLRKTIEDCPVHAINDNRSL
jgi:ferredoxin